MSLKLYNGYRIKGFSEKEFIEKYEYLKEVVEKEAKISIQEEISKIFYNTLDYGYGRQEDDMTVLEYVKEEIKEEIENLKKGYRAPNLDKDIGFALKEYKGDLYLYLFSEDREISKMLLKEIENIEEFGYWNNTDKPDSVTESHWGKRKKIWNELLTSYSFEKSGFSTFYFFKSLEFLTNIDYTYDIFKNEDYERRKKDYIEVKTISLVDKEKNGDTYETFSMSTYLKSRDEVKEGKHKELEEKVATHFEENYIKVTEDNFNSIKIKSMKEIQVV